MNKRKLGTDSEVSERKYLEQNAAAADIILSQEELAASGLRYPESMMASVNN